MIQNGCLALLINQNMSFNVNLAVGGSINTQIVAMQLLMGFVQQMSNTLRQF